MTGASASAIPDVDIDSLLSLDKSLDEVSKPVEELIADPEVQKTMPKSALQERIDTMAPEDASVKTPKEAKLRFIDLLSAEQRAALKARAPQTGEAMMQDTSRIINFGAPVLEKMNQSSIALLNEQKHIKIPEADEIVNNLMREMDGYNARYRNAKMEDFTSKIKQFFGGAKYNVETMIRDAKPIVTRIDQTELNVKRMEMDLEGNAARAKRLHEDTLASMNDVVAVLASLEAISEYLHERFDIVDEILVTSDKESHIDFEGRKYSYNEFKELHADYAQSISELEKSWFDWRQQFFIGYATAPTLRNLILVSTSMQRRLLVFRTQGLPAARRGLAMWQMAALAKGSAEVGDALAKGTNSMLTNSFDAATDAVSFVANAAQAPIVSEETVFSIIDSVKTMSEALVAEDAAGRELRKRNLAALEAGEAAIATSDEESRRKLVEQAVRAAQNTDLTKEGNAASSMSTDILSSIGVK